MRASLPAVWGSVSIGVVALLGLGVPQTARAVEILSISDLSTRSDDAWVAIPLHDDTFPAQVQPKVSSDVGRVISVVSRDGVPFVTWQPPAGFEGGTVTFRTRFKNTRNEKVDTTFTLSVPASPARPIPGTASPAAAAPNLPSVKLTWSPPPSGQAPADRQFDISTSFGSVGPVSVNADGTVTAEWTRPAKVDAPTMALVTLVDRADPRRRGLVQLPVQVAQSTTFTVPPDAKVSVQIGDETFGPLQASPAGTVAFDLRLDPRVGEGRLSGRTPHGDTVEQVVALPVRATPVAHFAPIPHAAAVGPGAESVPVAVAVWTPPGAAAAVVKPASSATPLNLQADDTGSWWTAPWTPPNTPGAVNLSVQFGDSKAKTSVDVVQGLLRVDGEASPTELAEGDRDVNLTARARAASNAEESDTVGIQVYNGVFTARPVRKGTSTSARARRNSGAEWVALSTEPPGSVAGEPARSVITWFEPVGDEQVLLRVAVVDPLGRAIANTAVRLSATTGSVADLPESVTTDGYGMAAALLPRPDGALGVQVSAAGHTATAGWSPTGQAVVGGDSDWTRLATRWRRAAPTFVVGPKAAPVVAAAPPTEAPESPSGPTADGAPPSGPEPSAPKKERPEAASDAAWLRVAASFQGSALSQDVSASDGAVGPLGVSVDDGINLGGLELFGLAWLGGGSFGLDASVQAHQGDLAADQTFAGATDTADASASSTFESSSWDLRLGARYRKALSGPLSAYGLAQVHRQSVGLYLWDDGDVAVSDTPLLGVRAGLGAMVEAGPFWLDAQFTDTFAPYPVRAEASARVFYELAPKVAVSLGGGMAWRRMTFEVDSAEVSYRDDTAFFGIGLGTALR